MKISGIEMIMVLILYLLGSTSISSGQEARLVYKITNSAGKNPAVMLKWYHRNLISKEGCNVYRFEYPGGNMIRCNSTPVLPLLDNEVLLKSMDSSLVIFAELLKNNPDLFREGLIQLHFFIQSFQSIEFSKILGICFFDSCLHPSKKYIYVIKQIKAGNEYELAISDTIRISEKEVKGVISDFACTQRRNMIELKWMPEDSLFYAVNIYRKEISCNKICRRNKVPIMISRNEDDLGRYQLPAVFYTDTFNNRNAYFIYYVKGIDFFGDEKYCSDSLKIIVRDSIPPGLVSNMKIMRRADGVSLSWKNPSDNDFEGCNIYRSSNSESAFTRINQRIIEGARQFFVDSLAKTGPWYYRVGSIDSSGNESYSEKLYIEIHDITAPEIPGHIKLVEDSGIIHLSWGRNKERDLAGYLIYRSLVEHSKLKPILINLTPLKDTFFFDKTISSKNDIIYQLAAIDSSSNTSIRSLPAKIRLRDRYPPVRPKITGIISNGKSVTISWLKNPDTDLATYQLRRISENHPDAIFSISSDSVLFRDTSLTYGIYYDYELQALDSSGNYSEPSKRASIIIKVVKALSNCPDLVFSGKSKKYNRLAWRYNKSDGLIGFSIFILDSLNSYARISEVMLKNEFIDKNVMQGKIYQYQLRAYFINGDVCYSQPIIFKIPDK